MDDKTTILEPDAPESANSSTIVIPEDAPSRPRNAAPAPPPAPDAAGNAPDWKRLSILNDLGSFLFPRRSVVDDTLELICDAKSAADKVEPTTEGCELEDVARRYDIAAKPFASGGQGRISKAVDRALGCEIAMKSLHDKFRDNEHARENFLREAKLTAVLDHPAIIPIHGLYGDSTNGMHLAMKMISGHTLSEYLKTITTVYQKKGVGRFNEAKSLRNRIEILLKVCEAVEYAHARKIIHRDLKPDNIMIGRHRETYVTDWGLATRLEEARMLSKVDGTPGYLAPEVLLTRRADVRSDIYSLGIILFEVTTLSPAFPDTDLATLLKLVKSGRRNPIRHRFRCRIDADLKAIIRKAANPDPNQRYRSVAEFSEDLRRYLTNDETVARPDGLFGKICRWSVNHRRGMLFMVMLVLLLTITAAARTLYKEMRWSEERRLRDNAMGSVYGNVSNTANLLGKDLERIENQLEQFRMNLFFSALKIDVPGVPDRKCFVPMAEYAVAPPPGFAESEAYGHRIDPDHACVFDYRGGAVEPARLKYFTNTGLFMREALLGTAEIGENAARERLLREGRPIKKIYFALADGAFACYPGSKDDFPPGYDPTQRVWYRRALEAPGRKVWSGPYLDSGKYGESMLTCSIALYGADRKFIGVAAIDFSLTKLAGKMLGPGGRYNRFTREKLLIKPDGEVIFRMMPPERAGAVPFNDPSAIRRMCALKYGTLSVNHNGRELLAAFAYLEPIEVLYAEILEMDGVVADQRARTVDLHAPAAP